MMVAIFNIAAPIGDLLERAGFIGWVLLAMSILALAVILLKLYQFHRINISATAESDAALGEMQRGDLNAALRRLKGKHHPAAKILLAALAFRDNQTVSPKAMEDELQRIAEREMDGIEWGFRPLAAVAQLSPLLGLLGTVVGMIRAFAELESAGEQVSPSLLAGGIWEALLTTAMGLAIAIPVRAALYYLEARADRAAAAMQHTAARALQALSLTPSDNPAAASTHTTAATAAVSSASKGAG